MKNPDSELLFIKSDGGWWWDLNGEIFENPKEWKGNSLFWWIPVFLLDYGEGALAQGDDWWLMIYDNLWRFMLMMMVDSFFCSPFWGVTYSFIQLGLLFGNEQIDDASQKRCHYLMMNSTPKSEDRCCWKLLCIVGLLYDLSWTKYCTLANGWTIAVGGDVLLNDKLHTNICQLLAFHAAIAFLISEKAVAHARTLLGDRQGLYDAITQACSKSCKTLVQEGWKDCLCWRTCVFLFLTPKCVNFLFSWGFEHVEKFGYMRLYHNSPSKCLLLLSPSNHLLHGCQLLSCYTYIDIWCCLTLQVYIR